MNVGVQAISESLSRGRFSVTQENKTEPLRECVRDALHRYFEHMEGHSVHGLYQMVISEVEPPLLETVLKRCGGNQTRAAEMLGMSRSTLRKKLAQYGLS